jgi:hypothetical protein
MKKKLAVLSDFFGRSYIIFLFSIFLYNILNYYQRIKLYCALFDGTVITAKKAFSTLK